MDQYRNWEKTIIELSDGNHSSTELAQKIGCPAKYVQRVQKRSDLKRLVCGSRQGPKNNDFQGGVIIDRDGYATVPTPRGFDHLGRRSGRCTLHRLVMELKIGRPLQGHEVVDHVDGHKLNNHPENLRLFSSNADHLSETLSGKCPKWSKEGLKNLAKKPGTRLPKGRKRVHTHLKRRKAYEYRNKAILQIHERYGIDVSTPQGKIEYLQLMLSHYGTTTLEIWGW